MTVSTKATAISDLRRVLTEDHPADQPESLPGSAARTPTSSTFTPLTMAQATASAQIGQRRTR